MDRPDETSGLSAAPPKASRLDAAAAAEMSSFAFDRPPPRPLPARAFVEPTEERTEASSALPEVQPIAADAQIPPTGPLSADAAFSEISAEASSRSLSAIEAAHAETPRKIDPRDGVDISGFVLPAPTPIAEADLGRTIPQRMFEPRFEVSRPEPAFDRLHIEPVLRPDDLPRGSGSQRPAADYSSFAKRAIKVLGVVAIGWLALVLALIVAYRFINPPASALMLQYWLTGQGVTQKWVPFEDISPNVVRAVLLSEDGRFCQHAGIDLEAIEDAIENTDGKSRGGSTISMQVIKNLFLWPSKSYVRKAIELPLTYVMELLWPKRRIMEVYLNIAQWGPGIFGIGAAAQYHFDKAARNLSAREAARLAVSLPNPLTRNAGRPGPGLQRLANAILVRMRLAPSSQLSCVLPKRLF